MQNKNQKPTIKLSKEFKDWLAKQAIRKDETYEEILKRLLEKLWHFHIISKPEVASAKTK